MKSKFFPSFFALPITAGVCGAYLHSHRLAYSFGIVGEGIATPAGYGFAAIFAIAFFFALTSAFILRGGVEFKSEKVDSFASAALSVAAVPMLLYAGVLFFSLSEKFDLITLVLGLFSVYAAIAFLVMGKYKLSERDSVSYWVCSAVPVFWACFVIIVSFREKIANPIIYEYVTLIFSYLAILIFSYANAGCLLGKKRSGTAVFACFAGLFFIIVELVSPLFLIGEMPVSTLYNIRELLPQLAYLILMPPVMIKIIKK